MKTAFVSLSTPFLNASSSTLFGNRQHVTVTPTSTENALLSPPRCRGNLHDAGGSDNASGDGNGNNGMSGFNGRLFRRSRRRGGGDNSDASRFQPFDGSKPLLPPWRPESLEQAFTQRAERIHTRVARVEDERPLVELKVTHSILSVSDSHSIEDNSSSKPPSSHDDNHTQTLYAHVVQDDIVHQARDGSPVRTRAWLRPLLLDGGQACGGGFVDLRGVASDLVVDRRLVGEVKAEVRLRLRVNLAATDGEVAARVAVDEAFGDVAAEAFREFVRALSIRQKLLEDDAAEGRV